MPTKIEKDAVSGQETTGHEWDGIKELNTPLPKWWVYVFVATVAWSLAFYVFYPSWPSLSSHLSGLAGYWSRAELEEQVTAQNAQRAPYIRRISSTSLEDIRKTPDLFNFALTGGRAAFNDNCAPCHGPGGSGGKGFPILADDDWLWGGDLTQIHRTISYGIRNANDGSRQSQMPRFGADGVLNPVQVNDVAEYVMSLSGTSKDAAAAARGKQIFADNCAACHAENGGGNQEVGAPNLRDQIWLYGGDKASIVQTITYARNGSMPAWSERLDDPTMKMLAIYVYSLGGGR